MQEECAAAPDLVVGMRRDDQHAVAARRIPQQRLPSGQSPAMRAARPTFPSCRSRPPACADLDDVKVPCREPPATRVSQCGERDCGIEPNHLQGPSPTARQESRAPQLPLHAATGNRECHHGVGVFGGARPTTAFTSARNAALSPGAKISGTRTDAVPFIRRTACTAYATGPSARSAIVILYVR